MLPRSTQAVEICAVRDGSGHDSLRTGVGHGVQRMHEVEDAMGTRSGIRTDGRRTLTSFHPVWGTRSEGPGSIRRTHAGIHPSPVKVPCSSEPRQISCRPRQIPRKGTPRRITCSFSASTKPRWRSALHGHAEGADAREDDPLGRLDDRWVVGDLHVGAQHRERSLHRTQVAHAEVDDGDHAVAPGALSWLGSAPARTPARCAAPRPYR